MSSYLIVLPSGRLIQGSSGSKKEKMGGFSHCRCAGCYERMIADVANKIKINLRFRTGHWTFGGG
jgi:hypothetical protein